MPISVSDYRHWKISKNDLNTSRRSVEKAIVRYHNDFRSKVKPTASNMLMMTWNTEARRQAQKYAEKCVFLTHNSNSQRVVKRHGSCGQNIYVSKQKSSWYEAVESWFNEYKDFTYGSSNYDFEKIGHYTQMVWATSHKLGCGVARCNGGPWGVYYNYICHYCPGGNMQSSIQFPYKVGKSCGVCPRKCVNRKLCTALK